MKKARTEKVSQHCSEKCALIELYILNAKELRNIEQRVVSRSKIAKHGDNHLKRRTRIDMNCKY